MVCFRMGTEPQTEEKKNDFVRREIIWPKVLFWIYLHCCAAYGFLLVFTQAKLMTSMFCKLVTSIFLQKEE